MTVGRPLTPPRGGEARPEPARSLAPSPRGGEGKEEGGREWKRESREKEAAGVARRRRGNRLCPHQPLPGRLQVESAEGADSAATRAAGVATSSPGPPSRPRGCWRGSTRCSSVPRRWLRAGGGRTRRKSYASAASSGGRAAPGVECSRATSLQVRGARSARGYAGPGPRAVLLGAARVLLWTAAALSAAQMGPAPLGGFSHPHHHCLAEPEAIHPCLYLLGPRSQSTNFPCTLNPGALA